MAENGKPNVLSQSTLVPLAVVFAICSGLIGLALWMEGRFSSVERSVERVGDRVARVEEILIDRVTFSEFETWTRLLGARNPTLLVPEPRK